MVTNRWLSCASILFRVLCLFQPGGSSERSHLLSQLVTPDVWRTFGEAIKGLRRWHQGLQHAGEIHATLPDPSLLLRGIDASTSGLLVTHPMIGFRVNAFRHQLGIDYNPTVASVVQLVRLLQAECEAASITSEGVSDKRARSAVLNAAKDPPPVKPVPTPPPPPSVAAVAVSPGKGEGKDKGSGKGKKGANEEQPCYKFGDGSGCRFGDACIFKHDRVKARKESRCLACGQAGHFRPDCTLVAPENRQVQSELGAGTEGSPKAGSPKAGSLKGQGKAPKAKSAAQAKGVVEDPSGGSEAVRTATASVPSGSGQESLIAEAAKLLKNVSIKAVRIGEVEDVQIDRSWLLSAITGPSDTNFALVDSGATNAFRPACEVELKRGKPISVDLASGVAELRINDCGTLLHAGQCQVILPAGYLIELGFTISWKKKGCAIRHPSRGTVEVTVVKGCPLISRELGLEILSEYEAWKSRGAGLKRVGPLEPLCALKPGEARSWLCDRFRGGEKTVLTEQDQFTFLSGLFPGVPAQLLEKACVSDVGTGMVDHRQLPWNRRLRRTVSRAKPGSVLISLSPKQPGWRGSGCVVSVQPSERGIESGVVFRQLLVWACSGVIGGVVKSDEAVREEVS